MKNSPADFKRVLIGIISDRKKVPDPPGFSPAIEPYLVLRSIALYNGVEIGRIDSFATIVGKLFYKLHRPKDRFPTTRVCDGDSIDVWKDMFEIPGGQSEHKAEFSEPIRIEDGWAGYFLHAFLMGGGYLSLQTNLVPARVIDFGLSAFNVRDSPNPKQTFQVLLEKIMDRPTMIYLLWILTNEKPDTPMWALDLASLLRKLIAALQAQNEQ
jgi:hypothetical protein